jgi:hypothetical protein
MSLKLFGQWAKIFLCVMVLSSCRPPQGIFPPPDLNNIPPRTDELSSGTTFIKNAPAGGVEREQAIYNEISRGNIPGFLRSMKPVEVEWVTPSGMKHECIFKVLPDYLAVGSDSDFVRIPMTSNTAQRIADLTDTLLPSVKMVDAIYMNARVKLKPQPLPEGPQMGSNEYYLDHNRMIEHQRLGLGAKLGSLIAGHKKDLVITNRLNSNPDDLAIYGWHRMEDGKPVPIQPLTTAHLKDYVDYSHGVRLVSKKVLVDGKATSIVNILRDPELSAILSDEGPIKDIRAIRKE